MKYGGPEALWSKHVSQGACPCYPLTTVLGHVVVQRLCGANMFHREHALAYPLATDLRHVVV